MVSTVCKAKDPLTCPYHGPLLRAAAASSVEQYFVARDAEVKPLLDWDSPEGNYSPVVKAKLKSIRSLMNQNGLNGWELFAYVEDDSTRGQLGMCLYDDPKGIAFMEPFLEVADEDAYIQLALHEIAHAKLPYHSSNGIMLGHNKVWAETAQSLGFKFGSVSAGPYVTKDYTAVAVRSGISL